MGYLANALYIEAKERSKELLDISKAKLDDVDDDLRRTFQAMEEVSYQILPQSKTPRAEWHWYDSQAKRMNEARIS
jgi:hypothetical protein